MTIASDEKKCSLKNWRVTLDTGPTPGTGTMHLFNIEASAPQLSVTRSDANLVVSWPKTADGFILDQSTGLAGWSEVPAATYQTNATSIFILVPDPIGNKFYRLSKP